MEEAAAAVGAAEEEEEEGVGQEGSVSWPGRSEVVWVRTRARIWESCKVMT